jgi:hypothetical protein
MSATAREFSERINALLRERADLEQDAGRAVARMDELLATHSRVQEERLGVLNARLDAQASELGNGVTQSVAVFERSVGRLIEALRQAREVRQLTVANPGRRRNGDREGLGSLPFFDLRRSFLLKLFKPQRRPPPDDET